MAALVTESTDGRLRKVWTSSPVRKYVLTRFFGYSVRLVKRDYRKNAAHESRWLLVRGWRDGR